MRSSCTGCPRAGTPLRLAVTTDSPLERGEAAGSWLGGGAAGDELAPGVLVQSVEEPVGDGEGGVVGLAGQGQAADQDVQARGGGGVVLVVGQIGCGDEAADFL